MEDINKLLVQRKRNLEKLLRQIEKDLSALPEGRLRISHKQSGNHAVQYYHCLPHGSRSGQYISKDDVGTAYALAEKSYLLQLRDKVLLQLSFLEKGIPILSDMPLYQVYTNLSPERRQLVTPLLADDSMYLRKWQEIKYDKLTFEPGTPVIMTERGERVRSKSEKILADKFFALDIPYHYEMPLKIPYSGTRYPDFTLLNKRTRAIWYLEHFGRMDDIEYVNKNLKKLNTYIKHGIIPGKNLIMTFETLEQPLDMKAVDQMIKTYLL